MSIMYSTGFRTGLLGTTGFKGVGMLDAFFIDLYTGSQPVDADQAPSGTLIGTVSVNDDGVTPLTLGTPANGAVGKNPAETWRATADAAGTIGWFRVRRAGDANDVSTTAVRVDGSVATIGGDLKLGVTTYAVGAPIDINVFSIVLKKLGVAP